MAQVKRWLVVPGIAGTWLACKGFALVLYAALFTTGAGGWLVAHGDHVATGILLVGVAVTAGLAKIGLLVRMRGRFREASRRAQLANTPGLIR